MKLTLLVAGAVGATVASVLWFAYISSILGEFAAMLANIK